MVDHVFKYHNKNLLIFHLVCPVKYRRKVFTESNTNPEINMFGIRCTIRIYLSWNWYRRRSRSLFNTNNSKHIDFRNGQSDQIYHGTRDVQATPRGENLSVGTTVLDRRILHQYGGTVRQSENDWKLCEEPRYQKLLPDSSPNAVFVLKPHLTTWYPVSLLRGSSLVTVSVIEILIFLLKKVISNS